jgi:hypothetical protein
VCLLVVWCVMVTMVREVSAEASFLSIPETTDCNVPCKGGACHYTHCESPAKCPGGACVFSHCKNPTCDGEINLLLY